MESVKAPTPEATDATADFYAAMNDPKRWVIKQSVPVFKPHERVDPATGKLIQVDIAKLYRIADNMSKMERQGGVPIRMTLGHTEPGKPETMQPPIGGYYRNARVATFGPKQEPAIVVDEWLDPQYRTARKNFPYRSAEYYDDTEQITGVALLTRDPYLDLGIVAYSRAGDGAVHYSRVSATKPTQYQFLTVGEDSMDPNGIPQAQAVNGAPVTPPVQTPQPQPVPMQSFLGPQPQPQPTPYANPQDPTQYGTGYSGPWPGPSYQKHNIGHNHPSGGAVYANQGQGRGQGSNPVYGRPQGRQQAPQRYADEDMDGIPDDMEGGPGGPPPPPGGAGGGSELQVVHDCLTKAVEALSKMIGGGAAPGGMPPEEGPPETPFPEQNARYRRGPQQPRSAPYMNPQFRGARYQRQPMAQAPAPGTVPPRTISGLPVGYQMKLDQLQYQLKQSNEALKVLYYERDQADTEWCVSEIRRLASLGYQVDEYEVGQLKQTPREHREAFLQHIAARYQRVPTEAPPMMMGDPTPGPEMRDDRPASREEMEAALKMTAESTDPTAYSKAIQQIRYGRQNGVQPGMSQLTNPYPEPALNGTGR